MNYKKTTVTALFVVFFIIGSYTVVPIGPVPIVLTNLFILLSVLLLDLRSSFLAIAIYVILGTLGLPVFSMGKGGIAVVLGPTGGYIVGYLLCVIVGNLLKKITPESLIGFLIVAIVSSLSIYPVGLIWLKSSIGADWTIAKTLSIGFYPFLIGDIIKAVVVAILAKMSKPYFKESL